MAATESSEEAGVDTVGHNRGYESLARLMSDHPENTIFRQFRALASKMLMYQQAQLLYDEEELTIASQCHAETLEKKCFNHSWREICDNPGAVEIRQKVDQVQNRLEAYYGLLLLTAAVEKLPQPNSMSLAFLQEWVAHRSRSDGFLRDIEAQAWDPSHGEDHVVLSQKATHDSLAVALSAVIVPVYDRFIGSRKPPTDQGRHGEVWDYRFEGFVLLGKILSVLLATGIPAGSIVVLYVVSSMELRLMIIAIFCFLFACIMTFIVRARRVDVFSTTAAFAAVQVVFVGGTTFSQVS